MLTMSSLSRTQPPEVHGPPFPVPVAAHLTPTPARGGKNAKYGNLTPTPPAPSCAADAHLGSGPPSSVRTSSLSAHSYGCRPDWSTTLVSAPASTSSLHAAAALALADAAKCSGVVPLQAAGSGSGSGHHYYGRDDGHTPRLGSNQVKQLASTDAAGVRCVPVITSPP